MLATEIHHNPGDGVACEHFHRVLEPMGFDIRLYRHSNNAGAEVLEGQSGPAIAKIRAAQWLSGIDAASPAGATTLMCVAHRALRPVPA